MPPARRIADSISIRSRSEVRVDPPQRQDIAAADRRSAQDLEGALHPGLGDAGRLGHEADLGGRLDLPLGTEHPVDRRHRHAVAFELPARPSGKSRGTCGRTPPRALTRPLIKAAMTAAGEGLAPVLEATARSRSLQEQPRRPAPPAVPGRSPDHSAGWRSSPGFPGRRRDRGPGTRSHGACRPRARSPSREAGQGNRRIFGRTCPIAWAGNITRGNRNPL